MPSEIAKYMEHYLECLKVEAASALDRSRIYPGYSADELEDAHEAREELMAVTERIHAVEALLGRGVGREEAIALTLAA